MVLAIRAAPGLSGSLRAGFRRRPAGARAPERWWPAGKWPPDRSASARGSTSTQAGITAETAVLLLARNSNVPTPTSVAAAQRTAPRTMEQTPYPTLRTRAGTFRGNVPKSGAAAKVTIRATPQSSCKPLAPGSGHSALHLHHCAQVRSRGRLRTRREQEPYHRRHLHRCAQGRSRRRRPHAQPLH